MQEQLNPFHVYMKSGDITTAYKVAQNDSG